MGQTQKGKNESSDQGGLQTAFNTCGKEALA
jgi:hypothetical protein